jgi:DNA polymerase-3 subunit alpha
VSKPRSTFIHLNVKTDCSFAESILLPDEIADLAARHGMSAVALTDTRHLLSVPNFYRCMNKGGIRSIIGCEVFVAPGSRFDKPSDPPMPDFRLILLAASTPGFKNLMRLVSAGYIEGLHRGCPRINREMLKEYRQGLIALESFDGGEVAWRLEQGDPPGARCTALGHSELFNGPERSGDNYFLEVQDHGLPGEKERVKALAEIARQLCIPLVASNKCRFAERKDAEMYAMYRAAQIPFNPEYASNTPFVDSPEFYFKSPAEMAEIFKEMPEAISNTGRIAGRCVLNLDEISNAGLSLQPLFPVPEGQTPDTALAHTTRTALEKLIAEKPGQFSQDEVSLAYGARLEKELEAIRKAGIANLFLIFADICQFARSAGYGTRPCFGSTNSSLVNHLLGITEIDPVEHNLVFEIYFNFPTHAPSWIAYLQFSKNGHSAVIDMIRKKYGTEMRLVSQVAFKEMPSFTLAEKFGNPLQIEPALVDIVVAELKKIVHPPTAWRVEDMLEVIASSTRKSADTPSVRK